MMSKNEGAIVIDTKMNNKKIETDFKKISDKTKNMINKYNKSIDSIKKQELALEKVKQKLADIESGNKVPSNIKTLQTELDKVNKELGLIDKKANDISSKQEKLSFEIGAQEEMGDLANPEKIKQAKLEMEKLDEEMQLLASKEEDAKKTAEELNKKLAELKKNNPEIQQLIQKIENMTSSLEESKNQTNQLGKKIKETLNQKAFFLGIKEGFDNIGDKVDKFKTRMTRLIGTVAIFGLIRKGLTSLRNSFTSLLKQNDAFNSSLNQIKANLMTAFAPIYNACLPAINMLMNALAKLTGTIAVFVAGLFGTSIDDLKKQAQGLSKSLEDVGKSGEEASGGLSSFDNLEVISSSTSSSSSSNTGIDYSSEITYSQGLLKILNKIKRVIEPIANFIKKFQKEHGTLATAIMVIVSALTGLLILKTIKKLLTGIGSVVSGVSADFTGFFDGIGHAATAIAILGGLALVIESITDLVKEFSESGLSLGQVAALLGIVLGEVAAAFAILAVSTKLMDWTSIAAAVVILGGMALVLETVTNLMKTLSDSGMTMGEVAGMLGIVLGEVVLVMTAMAAIAYVLSSNPLALLGLLALTAAISAVLLVVAETLPTILEACSSFIVAVAPYLIKCLETIYTGIENIIYALGTVLPPIIDSVGKIFDTVFSGIDKLINSIGTNICNILNTAKNLVTTVLSSILKFINELGPAVNRFVDNIITAVTKLINFIISGIEYLVNTLVIGGVNKIIKAINSISEYVGITIPTVSNMSIPRFIPQLATGAVIPPNSEFMAILGDQKRGVNIEAPLDTIVDAFNKSLDERGNASGELVLNNATFIIRAGSDDLSRVVVKSVRIAEKDLGKPLFVN